MYKMFGCFEEDELGRGGLTEVEPRVVLSAGDDGIEFKSGAILTVWKYIFLYVLAFLSSSPYVSNAEFKQ